MHHFLPLQAADLNRISLASWDWMVIGLFFLAMVWICWSVSRKKKETSGEVLNFRVRNGNGCVHFDIITRQSFKTGYMLDKVKSSIY